MEVQLIFNFVTGWYEIRRWRFNLYLTSLLLVRNTKMEVQLIFDFVYWLVRNTKMEVQLIFNFVTGWYEIRDGGSTYI